MEQNSLTHWGIKGMKWGRRRYQNKDGSLTPAGKKRYQDLQDEMDNLLPNKKKSLSEMTDDEIRKAIARNNLESEYRRSLPPPEPEKVSKGKQFAEGVLNKVIIPTATDVGKSWLKKKMSELLGIDVDKVKDKLPEVKTWEDMNKREDYYRKVEERKAREKEADKKAEKEPADKDKDTKDSKPKQETKSQEKKPKEEPKETSDKDTKDANPKQEPKSQEKKPKEEPEVERIKVTPDMIFGEGTSKGSQSKSESKSNRKFDDVIYDADWTDVTPSNVPAVYRNTGQSFISALLEDPKK